MATAPFSLSSRKGKRSAAVAQQLSSWETPPEDAETRKRLLTVQTFPGEGAEEAEGERKDETRKRGGSAVVGTWKEEEQRGGVPLLFL